MKTRENEPINPTIVGINNLGEITTNDRESVVDVKLNGLTKREAFAMAAMQGLCANSIPGSHHHFENLAIESVKYADALINALNEEK